MAEEHITLKLTMASVPAAIARRVPAAGRIKVSNFQVLRVVQKAGMIVLLTVLCYLSYRAVGNFFLKSVKVVGVSMVPTLQEGNEYLLNVWAFRNADPERNQIVVIRDPADHGLSVKRIVAVSGESVHFKNGRVYVNGEELDEPYLLPNTHTFTYSQAREQFITCGRDQFFVLGDNRPRSIDSRSYGPVSRQDILGLVRVQ